MTTARPPADRPLVGAALMVAFCVVAPLGDATAKALGALPLAQIMLVRYGMQAALLLPLVRSAGLDLGRRVWWLTVLRTLLHVGSFTAFVASLRFLPLADAVAILFVLPFVCCSSAASSSARRSAPTASPPAASASSAR